MSDIVIIVCVCVCVLYTETRTCSTFRLYEKKMKIQDYVAKKYKDLKYKT
jgi:hypothetical protein